MALPSRHLIRPPDLGALAAYGITEVPVLTVRIGLVPTGTEAVPHGEFPAPGQVVESNTVMAEAMLGTLGACCTRYPMVKDDPAKSGKHWSVRLQKTISSSSRQDLRQVQKTSLPM